MGVGLFCGSTLFGLGPVVARCQQRKCFFFPLDKEVSLAGCDALVEKNNGKNLYNRNVSPKKFSE